MAVVVVLVELVEDELVEDELVEDELVEDELVEVELVVTGKKNNFVKMCAHFVDSRMICFVIWGEFTRHFVNSREFKRTNSKLALT
jgi:hypothetical protein